MEVESKVEEGVLPLDLVESENEKKMKMIKSIIGSEITEKAILEALSQQNNNPEAAINHLLDSSPPSSVHKSVTSTGVRISATVNQENVEESVGFGTVRGLKVKEEPDVVNGCLRIIVLLRKSFKNGLFCNFRADD